MWQLTTSIALLLAVCLPAVVHGGPPKLVMNDKSEEELLGLMHDITKLLDVKKARLPGPIGTEVVFKCTTGPANYQQVLLNDDRLFQKLNMNAPVAFITHGWTSGSDRSHFQDMARNYSRHVGGNVCLVDWSNLAQYDYEITAKQSLQMVANYLTRFVRFLNLNGLNYESVTLIGHSLGAQISSFVGKSLNGQIGRIYALDPAGPMFTFPDDVGPEKRLTPTDAKYVQAIYTAKATLSMTVSGGHQNFYMNDNGESPQPSCEKAGASKGFFSQIVEMMTCSHTMAAVYFTASLDPKAEFTMKRCKYWWMYQTGLCVFGTKDKVGVWSKRISGDFYGKNDLPYPYPLP